MRLTIYMGSYGCVGTHSENLAGICREVASLYSRMDHIMELYKSRLAKVGAPGCSPQRRASAWESTPARLEAWAAGGGFTSCLVAAPSLQPIAVLERLLPLLAPSAPFAIFSNSPLVRSYHPLSQQPTPTPLPTPLPCTLLRVVTCTD